MVHFTARVFTSTTSTLEEEEKNIHTTHTYVNYSYDCVIISGYGGKQLIGKRRVQCNLTYPDLDYPNQQATVLAKINFHSSGFTV